MPKVLITERYLEDIADAIRELNDTDETYTPAEMASAIAVQNGDNLSYGSSIQDLSTINTATIGTAKVSKETII